MLGVVAGNHLRKRQIERGRRADAGDWRLRRRGVAARDRLAHEGVKSLFDPAAEYSVRLASGGLKLHDVHVLAEPLAKELDRVRRRAISVRRVEPHPARRPGRMAAPAYHYRPRLPRAPPPPSN